MPEFLHGLNRHPDATRFEVEDGLVRHAAASLLAEKTTITSIIVDVEAHERIRPGATSESIHPARAFDAFITVSGTGDEVSTPNLADLVSEVAVIGASWKTSSTEISELQNPWVGAATPGPKITAFFRPASSVSSPEYRSGVEELATMVSSSLSDAGSRVIHLEDGAAPFATAMSFWFVNASSADDAFGAVLVEQLSDSSLVDSSSLVFVEAIEHRIVPNPNAWETTTGVSPPSG